MCVETGRDLPPSNLICQQKSPPAVKPEGWAQLALFSGF
jgi:hypothetical protein